MHPKRCSNPFSLGWGHWGGLRYMLSWTILAPKNLINCITNHEPTNQIKLRQCAKTCSPWSFISSVNCQQLDSSPICLAKKAKLVENLSFVHCTLVLMGLCIKVQHWLHVYLYLAFSYKSRQLSHHKFVSFSFYLSFVIQNLRVLPGTAIAKSFRSQFSYDNRTSHKSLPATNLAILPYFPSQKNTFF
jgi:hypothetical protein